MLTPIDILKIYAKRLSTSDFYVAFDDYHNSDFLEFSIEEQGGVPINKSISKSTIYAAYIRDLSKHFKHASRLIKIAANQYSFYPIYDEQSYLKFFAPEPVEFNATGYAIVSHKMKRLGFVYAALDKTPSNSTSMLCLSSSIVTPTLFERGTNTQVGALPNKMHSSYKPFLFNRKSIAGIFLSMEDYFNYQQLYMRCITDLAISSCSNLISKHEDDIKQLQSSIEQEKERIEIAKKHLEMFELNLNTARVDADLLDC